MTPGEQEREQVERILRSSFFCNSPRMSRFLRFVVEEALAGRSGRIKESVIGVEVFDKDPAYDPRADATVRTEASKLRSRLHSYYEADGREDPVVVSVPKGGYAPAFVRKSANGGTPLPADGTPAPLPPVHSSWRWIGAAILILTLASGSWMLLGRRRLEKPLTPQGLEASRLAARGYTLTRLGTAQDLRNAIQYFNLAIAADPKAARAHADLSLAYAKLLETETAPFDELIGLAKSHAQEALRLDPSSAEAHHALAQSVILSDFDWDAGEREFQRALAIDPAYMDARYAYAHMCLTPRGKFDEAARQLNEGLRRDPLSGMLNTELASTDIKRGRIDPAIDRLRESLTRYPGSPGSLTHMAVALSLKSQDQEALSNLLKARGRSPGDPWIASYLALCYVRLGDGSKARSILKELLTFAPPPDSSIAAAYAALGEKDAAMEHLERAYAAHSMKLLWLGVDRRFEPLRGDPRFKEFVGRMRLPIS